MDNTLNADRRAVDLVQLFPNDLLGDAARGLIDLNAIARRELISRGLNEHGIWVGFPESERLARSKGWI